MKLTLIVFSQTIVPIMETEIEVDSLNEAIVKMQDYANRNKSCRFITLTKETKIIAYYNAMIKKSVLCM